MRVKNFTECLFREKTGIDQRRSCWRVNVGGIKDLSRSLCRKVLPRQFAVFYLNIGLCSCIIEIRSTYVRGDMIPAGGLAWVGSVSCGVYGVNEFMMALWDKVESFIKSLFSGNSIAGADLVVWLMILLAAVTLSCLVVFFVTLHFIQRNRHQPLQIIPRRRQSLWKTRQPIPLYVFGQPRRWMAFHTRNMGVVRNALGVTNAEVCSWEQGLTKATERNLFITPPIRGWVLVFGHYLPNPSDDIDAFYAFMRSVSAEVGEVQFFCLDAVVQEHAWVRLIDGNVVRSYVWAEGPLWNEGPTSSAELSLRMHCFDYGFKPEEPENFNEALQEMLEHNVSNLHALAARWSLDPLRVEPKDFASEFGLTGEMDHLQVG